MRIVRGLVVCVTAAAFVAGCLAVAQAAAAARVAPVLDRILAKKELVLGTAADMPPLNMTLKDGTIAGMEIDLARLVATGLEAKLTVKQIPFNDLLTALEAGQVDLVLSGMAITPARNARVGFAGPYFASGKSVLMKQENMASLHSTETMDNPDVTVAVLKGSTSKSFVERFSPKAKLVLTDDYSQAVAMVLDGKVRAMVADFPICMVAVYRYPDKGLTTLKEPLTYEPIGIALPPSDPLLLNLVQNLLTSLLNSGELGQLQKKWFDDTSWVPQLR